MLELPDETNTMGGKYLEQRTREGSHPLFKPFYVSLRIVDLARHCFASSRAKTVLFKESVITSFAGEEDIDFGLRQGEFADRSIDSVAEFIAWRARSEEAVLDVEFGAERHTAWLFLACGKFPSSGTERHGGEE
jgi:hypothetical protein